MFVKFGLIQPRWWQFEISANEIFLSRFRCSIFDYYRYIIVKGSDSQIDPIVVSLPLLFYFRLAKSAWIQMNCPIRLTVSIRQPYLAGEISCESSSQTLLYLEKVQTTILRQSGWSFNLSFSLWTDSTEVDRETPWRKVEAICAETRLVIIARPERVTLVIAVRTFLVSAGFSKEKETGGGKFMVVGRISHLASRSATNDFTMYAS